MKEIVEAKGMCQRKKFCQLVRFFSQSVSQLFFTFENAQESNSIPEPESVFPSTSCFSLVS